MPDREHRYNTPGLSPLAFLQAVYSDPSVPMYLRMLAAERAAPYEHCPVFVQRDPWPGEHSVVIKIEGLGINALEQIEPEVKLKVH